MPKNSRISMFGDIVIKNRPLRFAFLIPPEKSMLRAVMQTNCTLWGGIYNPIILVTAAWI